MAVFGKCNFQAGVQFRLVKRLYDIAHGPGIFCALEGIPVRMCREEYYRYVETFPQRARRFGSILVSDQASGMSSIIAWASE